MKFLRSFLVIAIPASLVLLGYAFWMRQPAEPKPIELSPDEPLVSEEVKPAPLADPQPEPLPEPASVPERDPLSMPFTVQAPLGEWANPLFENACEEASLLMVVSWLQGKETLPVQEARQALLELADFQKQRFGHSIDTDAADTEELLRDYFHVEGSEVRTLASADELKELIEDGYVVIVPANGRKLGNPYFTPPGPINHMLVVLGYDQKTDEFITHDPGTKQGAQYRYQSRILFEAIRDYPTAKTHLPNSGNEKNVIGIPVTAIIKE